MNLDVRTPMGYLFLTLGIILCVYGAISDHEIYARSLESNVNLIWGSIFVAFGALMLFLSRKKKKE